MLDIAYLWPNEPIEPESMFVFSTFPHPSLQREMVRALEHIGLGYANQSISLSQGDGVVAQQTFGYPVVGHWNIVAYAMNEPIDAIEQMEKSAKYWRVIESDYEVVLHRYTGKNGKIWMHFIVTNQPDAHKIKSGRQTHD